MSAGSPSAAILEVFDLRSSDLKPSDIEKLRKRIDAAVDSFLKNAAAKDDVRNLLKFRKFDYSFPEFR